MAFSILVEQIHRDSAVQFDAIDVLAEMGDKDAIEPLFGLMQSATFPPLARRAARALAKLGDEGVARLIHQMLEDSSAFQRSVAAYGLGEAKDNKSLKALIKALGDNESAVRKEAAASLGGQRREQLAVDPLIALLHDENAEVLYNAIGSLGEIRDRSALEPLEKLLNDEDKAIREIALWAIRNITGANDI